MEYKTNVRGIGNHLHVLVTALEQGCGAVNPIGLTAVEEGGKSVGAKTVRLAELVETLERLRSKLTLRLAETHHGISFTKLFTAHQIHLHYYRGP